MAAKLIVALTCFALCNASPYLNRYIVRNGRGYSIGQGYTSNAGGQATGNANIHGGVLQAYGSATSDPNQIARNAYGVPYPGEVVAKAEVYDGPGVPVQPTPTFYTVPAPETFVTYQPLPETPTEIIYEYPGNVAQSSAVINENAESITSARTVGTGSAQASTGGFNEYARIVPGNEAAYANSQSSLGSTSAVSQTNGGYASSTANNAQNSAVVSTNSQGMASSKADVNTLPSVVVGSTRNSDLKGISWRFGTAYNVPAPGQAQVSSQANGGIAKSTAHTDGVVTSADAQGYGSANANANLVGGYVNSAANSNNFARYTAGNEFGASQSTINNGLGNIKSYANSNGFGNANSHADMNEQGVLSSVSNSNGFGTAGASANSAPGYALFRADGIPYIYTQGPSVITQTSGQGSASATTHGLNSGYRVINSVANTFGNGVAQANASA